MIPQGIFNMIGAGVEVIDFNRFGALSEFDWVVPRTVVAVAPGVGQYTEVGVELKASSGWAYLWAGVRGQWSHANFMIQFFDSSNRAIQSEMAAGPLVLIGAIGRPWGLIVPVSPGAQISARIRNLDTVNPLTLDLLNVGWKASPVRGQ